MSRRQPKGWWSWPSFIVGALLFRSGKLGKLLAAVLLLGVARLYTEWLELPEWARLLIGAALLALVLVTVYRRLTSQGVPAWLGRTTPIGLFRTVVDPFWVYLIFEWRDGDGRLLTRYDGRRRGHRHLVYVGKANDFDRRMAQHQVDKAWWHDELEFEAIRCFSEQEALEVERELIVTRAHSKDLRERPRENRSLNPTYDPARCEQLRRQAVPA